MLGGSGSGCANAKLEVSCKENTADAYVALNGDCNENYFLQQFLVNFPPEGMTFVDSASYKPEGGKESCSSDYHVLRRLYGSEIFIGQ